MWEGIVEEIGPEPLPSEFPDTPRGWKNSRPRMTPTEGSFPRLRSSRPSWNKDREDTKKLQPDRKPIYGVNFPCTDVSNESDYIENVEMEEATLVFAGMARGPRLSFRGNRPARLEGNSL